MFKKEITYGHKVLSKVAINGNTTTHTIVNAETGEEQEILIITNTPNGQLTM